MTAIASHLSTAELEAHYETAPIDPLNYAMPAARGLTHSIRDHHKEATEWMESAIRAPNTQVQIYAFAPIANELSGNRRLQIMSGDLS